MVTGVILAGGRGVRMGGNKAAVAFAGRPLVQWSADALQQVVQRIVIAVAPEQQLPALECGAQITVCEDMLPGRGPLTGIFTGLHCAGADDIVTVPCDAPLVAPDVLRLLISHRNRCDAIIPMVAGRLETAFGVYSQRCAPAIIDALNSGDLSVRSILSRVNVHVVEEDELREADPALRTFVNVNTRAQLEELEASIEACSA